MGNRSHEVEKNFIEEALGFLDYSEEYLKFTLNSKLQNLVISCRSFEILKNSCIKGIENSLDVLKNVLMDDVQGRNSKVFTDFVEKIGSQVYVVDIVEEYLESVGKFDSAEIFPRISPFEDAYKSRSDGKALLIDSWSRAIEDENALYEFNDRIDKVFWKTFSNQQKYLEFGEFRDPRKRVFFESMKLRSRISKMKGSGSEDGLN